MRILVNGSQHMLTSSPKTSNLIKNKSFQLNMAHNDENRKKKPFCRFQQFLGLADILTGEGAFHAFN